MSIQFGKVVRNATRGFGFIDKDGGGQAFFRMGWVHDLFDGGGGSPSVRKTIEPKDYFRTGQRVVFEEGRDKKGPLLFWLAKEEDWKSVEKEIADRKAEAEAKRAEEQRLESERQGIRNITFRGFRQNRTTYPDLVGTPEQILQNPSCALSVIVEVTRWEMLDGDVWKPCVCPFQID